MNAEIFAEVLNIFDRAIGSQKRKVLLFLDNCSAHAKIELKNVNLQFFPPNVTPRCQPLDMGVIAAFKLHYKSEIQYKKVQALNINLQVPKLTLFDSLFLIKNVWTNKVKEQSIRNCFRKAGFVKPVEVVTDENEDELFEDNEIPQFIDDFLATSEPVDPKDSQFEGCEISLEDEQNCEENEGEIQESEISDHEAFEYTEKLARKLRSMGLDDLAQQSEKIGLAIYKSIMENKVQTSITDFFN